MVGDVSFSRFASSMEPSVARVVSAPVEEATGHGSNSFGRVISH
jgi:hypothetical protein